ncbi:MAG: ATP-binding protein [Candidatus Auribacterota bacterium]|jgi:signal transduction histidine kinase|nr:ATP-binding protein [Candidatus Auribacterota bacterium]
MNDKERFVQKIIDKFEKIESRHLEDYLLRLTHERHFLEELFNVLEEGILVLDEYKQIVLINLAARNMLGIASDEITGKPILKQVADERFSIFLEKTWEFSDKSISTELILQMPRKTILSVTIINYTSGEDDMVMDKILVFNDITNKRTQIEALLNDEKMNTFNLLSAGVAHEIGNPLNSLDIHLQLLQNLIESLDTQQKEEMIELTTVARSEISRLDNIIKRFLKSIRPFRLKISEQDISKTVGNLVDSLKPEIQEAGIRLEYDMPSGQPLFLYDDELIFQALHNVVKNAVQATPSGGIISITIENMKDNYCKITVKDTGKGIPNELLNKIFDPYFTTREEGTGLGLMIVRRIIDAHGGNISVMSEEGKGTLVELKIPIRKRGKKLLPQS